MSSGFPTFSRVSCLRRAPAWLAAALRARGGDSCSGPVPGAGSAAGSGVRDSRADLLHAQQLVRPPGEVRGRRRGVGAKPQTTGRAQSLSEHHWLLGGARHRRLALLHADASQRQCRLPAGQRRGRRVMDAWDPAGRRRRGGLPNVRGGRRHYGCRPATHHGGTTLRMDLDAGTERRFHFGATQPPASTGIGRDSHDGAMDVSRGPRTGGAEMKASSCDAAICAKVSPEERNPTRWKRRHDECFVRSSSSDGGRVSRRHHHDSTTHRYCSSPREDHQFKKRADATGWSPTPYSARPASGWPRHRRGSYDQS